MTLASTLNLKINEAFITLRSVLLQAQGPWHWRGVSPLLSHQGVNANVTTLTEGRHYAPYGPLQQSQHEEGLFADRQLSREQGEHLVR